MNFPWAICLAAEAAGSLTELRLEKGIEVALDNSVIWLRGPQGEERLARQLRMVPAQARFEWIAKNQLRRAGERIPSMGMPALNWVPLSELLGVDLAAAAFPAAPPEPVPLRLERSGEEREAELLLALLDEWHSFVRHSSRLRMRNQVFAVADDGRVLVRGRPLPSLPGSRFVRHGRVAVPAGYKWRPAVDLAVVERCLEVGADEMVLWGVDGMLTRFHPEQWIPATRPAVWATLQALRPSP